MTGDSFQQHDNLARKIRHLEERLNHVMHDSDRAQLASRLRGLQRQLEDLQDQKIANLWLPDSSLPSTDADCTHECANCGSLFSHDDEKTFCNEIKGKYYCDICFESAEHSHTCPVCFHSYDHVVPGCPLPDISPCVQHNSPAEYGARGLAGVAGMETLKKQLFQDVVLPLKNPEEFEAYRLSVPNGILLFGPPGCGKTYIARHLAEELNYFYQEVFPSQIGGTYIHETALNIRKTFDRAAERAPSVLFIDEFEGLVPSRSGLRADQSHTAEEVNEFLKQIESCASRQILLIAATNEPWRIDSAVQRTGRLDIKVYVGAPDLDARIAMLNFHLANRPFDLGIDMVAFARTLVGYSASDVKFLIDQAARLAWKARSQITVNQLVQSRAKVPPSITERDESRYKTFKERGA